MTDIFDQFYEANQVADLDSVVDRIAASNRQIWKFSNRVVLNKQQQQKQKKNQQKRANQESKAYEELLKTLDLSSQALIFRDLRQRCSFDRDEHSELEDERARNQMEIAQNSLLEACWFDPHEIFDLHMAEEDRHLFLPMNADSERTKGPLRVLYLKKNRVLVGQAMDRANFRFLHSEVQKEIAAVDGVVRQELNIDDFELDVCIAFASFFKHRVAVDDACFEVVQSPLLCAMARNHFALVQ